MKWLETVNLTLTSKNGGSGNQTGAVGGEDTFTHLSLSYYFDEKKLDLGLLLVAAAAQKVPVVVT